MVTVGELACFEGMPTGRLGMGSAFAKASGDSDVRFQLSANTFNLSTIRIKSVCYGFVVLVAVRSGVFPALCFSISNNSSSVRVVSCT